MAKIHAELNNQSLNGTSSQEITRTTIQEKNYLDVATVNGVLSEGNSSTDILTSGATFTGTGEINAAPQVGVMVKTDQPGTMYFDFSGDGTNWDSTFPVNGFRVAANIPDFHTAVKLGRYFRVRFVNDNDGDQTFFRLFTYYGDGFVPSVSPVNQSIGIDTDSQVTRPTQFYDEVVRGLRSGVTHFTKFAFRTGLTASAGEQMIWAATPNTFTPMTSAETFTIAYNNTTDGAGGGATGATQLQISYIDADGLAQVAIHTLGSSGSDVTSFTGLGINRVAVSASGSSNSNVNDITLTATTATTTQAFVPAGLSVTQQLIYFTDSNSFAVGRFLWINTNKLSGGGAPRITIKGYVFNRSVTTTYEIFRVTIDTNAENTIELNEPIGFRFSPTDVLYFVADTDTNNATVNIRMSLVEYKQT